MGTHKIEHRQEGMRRTLASTFIDIAEASPEQMPALIARFFASVDLVDDRVVFDFPDGSRATIGNEERTWRLYL